MSATRPAALVLALALALAGCGAITPATPSPAATAPQAPTRAASPPSMPTPPPAPTAPPTAAPAPPDAALAAAALAALPARATEPVEGGAGRVAVVPLQGEPPAPPLRAVFSTGAANAPFQHFVAIYAPAGDGWAELGRVALANPPVLRDGSVRQVAVVPGEVWVEVRGESGLIGPCCYDLLRFDGAALRSELSVAERTIESAEIRAGEGGAPEVVVTIQPYGGAAGPAPPKVTQVYVWDGQRMVMRP